MKYVMSIRGWLDTRDIHARFLFLKEKYVNHLSAIENHASDQSQVAYHRTMCIEDIFLFFVGIAILVDKSATYIDVVYINNFLDI